MRKPKNQFLCSVTLSTPTHHKAMENKNAAPNEIPAIATGAHVLTSTDWDGNSGAHYARLNFVSPRTSSAWVAGVLDVNQWLEVVLPATKRVTSVAIQGRYGFDQWVTQFSLEYSLDGLNWEKAADKEGNKTFAGAKDRDTVVKHSFKKPLVAKFVKFRPSTWHSHISMRCEVFYSDGNYAQSSVHTIFRLLHFHCLAEFVLTIFNVQLNSTRCFRGGMGILPETGWPRSRNCSKVCCGVCQQPAHQD